MILTTLLLILNTQSAQAEIKPHMQNFLQLTEKIEPYIIDKNKYLDPKNEKEIQANLTDFVKAVKKAKKEKETEFDDMKFVINQLNENLEEAEMTFKEGNKIYSHWVLKASLNNCYSCHTQKSLPTTNLKENDKKYSDDLSQADFLFIVRNYDKSMALYEKLILNYPKNNLSSDDLEDSLLKVLYYNIRVQKDDSKTLQTVARLLKNSELNQSEKNELAAWKKYLTNKQKNITVAKLSSEQKINQYVEKQNQILKKFNLYDHRNIVDFDTSRVLFEALSSTDNNKQRPSLLYWLAYHGKNYRQSMFDLSAENYLKECMTKYSKNKIAKKCFALYKDMITISFTGSRGTDIPLDVQKNLKEYETLVK